MSVAELRDLFLKRWQHSPGKRRNDDCPPFIWLRAVNGRKSELTIVVTNRMPMNLSWCLRLGRLERDAKHVQYLMACLSTLGGANYLCNKPHAALRLARQQELLGLRLGSEELVIRARVFQAVNHATLGDEALAFYLLDQCETMATQQEREQSLHFVVNMRRWLEKELPEICELRARQEVRDGRRMREAEAESALEANGEVVGRDPLKMLLNYKYDKELRACI